MIEYIYKYRYIYTVEDPTGPGGSVDSEELEGTSSDFLLDLRSTFYFLLIFWTRLGSQL